MKLCASCDRLTSNRVYICLVCCGVQSFVAYMPKTTYVPLNASGSIIGKIDDDDDDDDHDDDDVGEIASRMVFQVSLKAKTRCSSQFAAEDNFSF